MKYFQILFFVLFLVAGPTTASLSEELLVSMAVGESSFKKYQQLLKAKGSDALSITEFESPYSTRSVVSMIILQQAIALGGLNCSYDFQTYPTPSRQVYTVKAGENVLLGNDMWAGAFDDTVYQSSPYLKNGEFLKVLVGRKTIINFIISHHRKT